MKKKVILLAGAAMMMVFQACQDKMMLNDVENRKDSSTEIQFSNYVSGLTRASKATGASFESGDQMEVYGFQITQDGDTTVIFNNQLVQNTGQEIWTYTPPKYWEKNSKYDFFAIYPYSEKNSFDLQSRKFSVSNFVVEDTASAQIDLMVAQQITNHQPYNVVNFVFNHLLSNVNFYVQTAQEFDTTGIKSVQVTKFDVTGLYSKGSFAQSGWSSKVFTGAWTPDATSVYDMPEVTDAVYKIGGEKATITGDLLLLPQAINDNAKITVEFKLIYSDNTGSVFNRTVALNQIVGKKKSAPTQVDTLAKWEPNYRYNYIISVNPSITDQGGHYLPIANPDHDQPELENQDPENPIKPTVNIIEIDNNNDGVTDEWWVDEGPDDEKDYPIIWQDIDNDGKLEALPDRNGDGQPDDSDEDGNPDVIWIDTDNDSVVDTELEREITKPDVPGTHVDPTDPSYPDTAFVDYDGGAGGGYKVPTAWLIEVSDGEYVIDLDSIHNGENDITVLWLDIDGDGKLEGIADKNGDGKLTEADTYDNDGKDYLGNDNQYDVILYAEVITKDDGSKDYKRDENDNIIWHELEKESGNPDVPEIKTMIEFSAEVTDWNDAYDAEYILK